jgi:hypothetical protein
MQTGTYRILALYTFTLSSANGNWMALEIIPGQNDEAATTGTLTLVPLPLAAWAGLAMVGGFGYVRNRRHKLCSIASDAMS